MFCQSVKVVTQVTSGCALSPKCFLLNKITQYEANPNTSVIKNLVKLAKSFITDLSFLSSKHLRKSLTAGVFFVFFEGVKGRLFVEEMRFVDRKFGYATYMGNVK